MSNRVTITLHIDIPEGGPIPEVNYGPAPAPTGATQAPAEPRREDYPPPIDEGPLQAAMQAFPPEQAAWRCPDHGTAAKTVPGGVSKRTGAAYSAFQVCSTAGCDKKPR